MPVLRAVDGITFDATDDRPEIRVEAGDIVPADAPASAVEWLQDAGYVIEAPDPAVEPPAPAPDPAPAADPADDAATPEVQA